jgi:hypothetical protein
MGGKGFGLPAHGKWGPSHFLPWDGMGPSHMGNPMGMSMSICKGYRLNPTINNYNSDLSIFYSALYNNLTVVEWYTLSLMPVNYNIEKYQS